MTALVARLQLAAWDIRRQVVVMTGTAGSGHPGGSLSVVDILTALYLNVMRFKPDDLAWPGRDRLILSKGHAAPALYATLEQVGILARECTLNLRKLGSELQGHPDCQRTPGVEVSGGSLGQGLSVANGMALAGRLDGRDYRVYCIVGDGESDEGQVWEAAMAAAHFRLDHVTVVVDYNKQQIDGWNKDVMNLEPLTDKWRAFGWHVVEADGHSFPSLLDAFRTSAEVRGKPSVIIAHTVKGKGVSFMENNLEFHGRAPTAAEVKQALAEIDAWVVQLQAGEGNEG